MTGLLLRFSHTHSLCSPSLSLSLSVHLRSLNARAALLLAAELLPPSDAEIMDWVAETLADAEAAALTSSSSSSSSTSTSSSSSSRRAFSALGGLPWLNLSTGYTYRPALGFYAALDGAQRLGRLLPAGGLLSAAPPGSLYLVRLCGRCLPASIHAIPACWHQQGRAGSHSRHASPSCRRRAVAAPLPPPPLHHQDMPSLAAAALTLDYDLAAPLAAPRWLDSMQALTGLPYTPGAVLIADVRYVVPGARSSAGLRPPLLAAAPSSTQRRD